MNFYYISSKSLLRNKILKNSLNNLILYAEQKMYKSLKFFLNVQQRYNLKEARNVVFQLTCQYWLKLRSEASAHHLVDPG